MKSSKVLNFQDFLGLPADSITENEKIQNILKDAIEEVAPVIPKTGGERDGLKEPILKSGIDLQNMFWSTSMGRKFLKKTDEDYRKEMSQRGLLDSKYTADEGTGSRDASSGNTTKEKELQELFDRMGLGKSEDIDFGKLPDRGSYEFSEAKNMDWDDLSQLLKEKKIKYHSDKYTLVALRNHLDVKKKMPNRFTDALFLLGPDSDRTVQFYPATTTPGPAFMVKSYRNLMASRGNPSGINPKGLAIIQPGVYTYKLGKHKGKEDALIQSEPVKVHRYNPVDSPSQATFKTLSPGNEENGQFGINIHQGADIDTIDNISSGCLATQYKNDMKDLIRTLKDAGQSEIELVLLNLD
jgi:hypothetical protein